MAVAAISTVTGNITIPPATKAAEGDKRRP